MANISYDNPGHTILKCDKCQTPLKEINIEQELMAINLGIFICSDCWTNWLRLEREIDTLK